MTKETFELRGRRYELSRADVEDKLKRIEPKPVTKYQVLVNGRFYPPKQALAVTIGKSVAGFTTMDASRILSKLGFEVTGLASEVASAKTISERLFEDFLSASGLTQFCFEPQQDGTLKRPDYSLRVLSTEILFEVKQFDATPEDFERTGGAYDPYRVIREKIEAARKKFKDLDRFCCCLVLYNNNKPLVDLHWQFIYAAMFGNLSIRMPVNVQTGIADPEQAEQAFNTGGKMFRYRNGVQIAPQNQTIGSILVLEHYNIGMQRFENAMKRKEESLGRSLELEEFWAEIERARGTSLDVSALTQPRVVVHENPFAKIPLPRELFRGPYDERYGGDEGRIRRVFCGEQLAELEKNASEA
jgi:hypothetical protein